MNSGYTIWGNIYPGPNKNGRFYANEALKKAAREYMKKLRQEQRKEKLKKIKKAKINEIQNR